MSTPEFRERAVQFGRSNHLNGILTLPKNLPGDPHAVLIMVNAGIISRIGASRLQVELARHVSALGVASFRFDLSGLGNSEIPDSTAAIQEIVDQDIVDAIQILQKQFPNAAIIGFGLCSGAYDFLHCLEMKGDLKAAVLLDLASEYKNKNQVLHHYLNRFNQMSSWKNFISNPLHSLSSLGNRIGSLNQTVDDQSKQDDTEIGVRPIVKRERFESILNYALEQEVNLLFVFTGGLAESYNYENQFADTFPQQSGSSIINWDYLPEADHLFSRKAWRDQLFDAIDRWLVKQILVTD